jgi:hypothetical protein
MERVFGTLQQRLPPMLRLHGIATIEAANRYLREVYIAGHNRRFAVAAAERGGAFVPFLGAPRDILCIPHERVVGNDDCMRYEGRVLQIPEQRLRRHFRQADRSGTRIPRWHARDLPRLAAVGYRSDGTLIEEDAVTRSAA